MKVKLTGVILNTTWPSHEDRDYVSAARIFSGAPQSKLVKFEVEVELDYQPQREDLVEFPNGARARIQQVIHRVDGGCDLHLDQ
jgi:hypothetical protein